MNGDAQQFLMNYKSRQALRELQDKLVKIGEEFGWSDHVPVSSTMPEHITLAQLRRTLFPEYAAQMHKIVHEVERVTRRS